jgi:hypothetical protein
MTDQLQPKRWRLKVWAAGVGTIVALAVAFVYLSAPPSAGGAMGRLRPGQTYAEAREILQDADWFAPVPKDDGRSIFFADGELGLITIDSGRVVKVERQPDNGPFWERTRRTLERRWRTLERLFRRRK